MSELAEALQRTIELLDRSGASAFSTRSPARLRQRAQRLLASVEAGRSPRSVLMRLALQDLYGPAGDLQDVSIANGWSAEFLRLAEAIDDAISRYK